MGVGGQIRLKGVQSCSMCPWKVVCALLSIFLVRDADQLKGSNCDVKLSSLGSVNGSITSPGFPGSYPSRTRCQYEFTATARQRVQLVFTDFSLHVPNPLPSDCDGADSVIAFVLLRDREGRPRREKIDTYCGPSKPIPIMSNGPKLFIHFIGMHSAKNARGFRAKYYFTNNYGIAVGEQDSSYPCAFRFRAKIAVGGHFTSPNYPGLYPRETECHFFFHGEARQRVRIFFHYFDIEGVPPICDESTASDFIEFSNFMGLDRKYTRQCGRIESGLVLVSEKSFFRVTFKSNDRLDATGFNATYQFFEQGTTTSTTTVRPPRPSRAFAPDAPSLSNVMILVALSFATAT